MPSLKYFSPEKSENYTWNIKGVPGKRKCFGQWIFDLVLERIKCSISLMSVSENLTVGDLIHMPLLQSCYYVTIWSHDTKAAGLCTVIGKFNAAVLPALYIRALFCSYIKKSNQLAKVLFIFVLNWDCVILDALFGSNLPKNITLQVTIYKCCPI